MTNKARSFGPAKLISKPGYRFLSLCTSAENGDVAKTEDIYQTLMKEFSAYELQVIYDIYSKNHVRHSMSTVDFTCAFAVWK
eukprot:9304794-Pyramimonas_sp.AAC.1